MSRSGSDVTQTPERRSSSSALLDAFRSLTGSRVQHAASPSSTGTWTSSPGQMSHVDDVKSKKELIRLDDRDGEPPGPKDDSAGEDDNLLAGKVVGGPPGLQRLLRRLNSTQPGEARIVAAEEVALVLEQYPIQNIIAIWEIGKDLIEEGKSEKESVAGYHLIKACIDRSDLTAYERCFFYNSILPPGTLTNLDRRLEALKQLTENGRNIEGIENLASSRLASVLENSFKRTLAEREERKINKKAQAQAVKEGRRTPVFPYQLKEEKTLYLVFEYIMEITKYNQRSFSDGDIATLLDALLSVCKQARTREDMAKSLEVMNVLMTRFHIGTATLSSCLEVLCDVIHQIAELRNTACGITRSLLRSHLGHSAITVLLELVRQSPESDLSFTSLRGAILVLRQTALHESDPDVPAIPLTPLLHSLRCCLAFQRSSKVDRLEEDVLILVTQLINHPTTVDTLIQQQDLTDLLAIVEICLNNHSARLRSKPDTAVSAARNSSPHSSVSTGTAISDDLSSKTLNSYDWAITSLLALSAQMDLSQETDLVNLLLRVDFNPSSTEAVKLIADLFLQEHLLYPSREDWYSNTRRIVEKLLKDQNKPAEIRVQTIETFEKAYGTIEAMVAQNLTSKFALLIIENIIHESNPAVSKRLHDFAITVVGNASNELFQSTIGIFDASIIPKRPSSYIRPSPDSPPFRGGPRYLNPLSKMHAEGLIRLFLAEINLSAARAKSIYNLLLKIAECADCESDARVMVLKLLFRIRSDASHRLIVVPSIECEGLAVSLCRTVETFGRAATADGGISQRASQIGEGPGSATTARVTSSGSSFVNPRLSTRSGSTVFAHAYKPTWLYPGPKGLPEDPSPDPSPVLFSSLDAENSTASDNQQVLESGRFLEVVITILQQGAEWEVYSYVLVHLGAQLINRPLFKECIPQIKHLRSVICEQARNQTYHEPPINTGLRKSDVAICIFHILTILIGYHEFFGRNEQDEIIKMFIAGIGTREKTSKGCIHALSVCCHDMPVALVKSMDQVLLKMAQVITQSQLAVHILEFLATVARLPDLFKNFRDEDYKTVLGICLRYVQYVRDDQKDKAMPPHLNRISQASTLRHSGTSREFNTIAEEEERTKNKTDDLPQYVYALAFHVITFWFMSMKIDNRPKHVQYIMSNLVHTDHLGKPTMDEQSQVTMDMVERVAYSDRDETAPDPHFAKASDGPISKRTWLVGQSILTIETAGRSGMSQITRRRPSSTRYSTHLPHLVDPPRHQVPLTTGVRAEIYNSSDFVGIYPEDIMQEYYAPMHIGIQTNPADYPILLRDEEAVHRAIGSFDRIPALDSHKIGVIYVAEGQTHESEILGNTSGSDDYMAFIEGLGTLIPLRGSKMNMQGLDRTSDFDGPVTFCWRDRVTEIVYHITTLMPTYPANDPRHHQKKAHIGNDFVNIIWNASGRAFDPATTIPSQVTLVHIEITPEAYVSPHHPHIPSPSSTAPAFYKVRTHTHPTFPATSPAAEAKLVSAPALPAFVRLLALNASVGCAVGVAAGPDAYVSSWRARLQLIKKLRERYGPAPEGAAAAGAVGRRRSVMAGGEGEA